ncbi:hypothetical protein ACLESO_06625, partial [Pyxidicoccus sp. 3LG]
RREPRARRARTSRPRSRQANQVETPDATEAQLDADLAEIEAAAAEDPQAGAELLEQKLADASPEYREQLMARAQPVVERMGAALANEENQATVQGTLDSLSRSAELVSPASQQAMGNAFVRGLVGTGGEWLLTNNHRMGGAFVQAMGNGNGAAFGLAIADAARAQGLQSAEQIEMHMLGATATISAQFRDAQAEVDQLNGELYAYLDTYGPYMTEEQQQAAVAKWMEDHQEAYARWEELGGQMVSVIESMERTVNDPNASQSERELAQAVLQHELPQVAFTQAGQQLLADAAAAEGAAAQQGQDVHTLLDTVNTLAAGIENPEERQAYLDTMGALSMRAVGNAIVQAEAGGDPARVQTLLAGVTELAPLLGIPEEQMRGIAGDLLAIANADANDVEAVKALLEGLSTKLEQLPGGVGGRAGQLLGGLGLALSVLQVKDAWEGFSDADVQTQIATLVSTVQLGADGGIWAMEALGKVVPTTLRAASVIAGGIIAGIEVYNGVQAWQDGNHVGAVGHGFLATGGALMALGATTLSVPVAGWIAGAAMIIVGGVMVGVGNDNEAREAREEFLRSAGVPEDVIGTLAEDPERVKQLAEMGLSVDQLIDLARRAPTLFTLGNGEGGTIQGLQELQRQFGLTGDELYGMLEAVMAANPESPASAVEWFVANAGGVRAGGMMPTSPEGWIQKYEELLATIDPEGNPELHATVTAVLAELNEINQRRSTSDPAA